MHALRSPLLESLEHGALLRELVRCATLAPNGHNTQPWKFGLSPDAISIRPDLSRRTPVVDPDEHHLWVSLGCAAENLVLAAGAVAAVYVEHSGTFNMSDTGEKWKPFTSTQRVIAQRPGFDWEARIEMMLGLTARVHDAYIAGEGILYATLFGLVSLVNLRGTPEMAQGELMRFFAEAAWYPTALLPSQGVQWKAIDDFSANATLKDSETTVTLLFRFDEDGLIKSGRAGARGRTIAGTVIPTPWEGRWSNYERRDGMCIPTEGEVAWVLPDGPKPYWRGRITSLRYKFAQ